MDQRHWIVRGLVPLGIMLLIFGCADSYGGRQAVSGRVILEGQPLKSGSIHFEPLDGQDTTGGSGIENGEYHVPRQNGLKPGKYLVQLTAPDGKTPATEAEI